MIKLKNVKEFMDKETPMRHGDRITTCCSIFFLGAMGLVLNYQLCKSRIKNIDLEVENSDLGLRNACLEVQNNILKDNLDAKIK